MNKHRNAMKKMRETAKIVNPLLMRSLEPLRDEFPQLYDPLLHLPKIRVGPQANRPMLRPLLVRLGYEAAGGVQFEKIAPLAAAVELLNISTYVIDDILDKSELRQQKPALHIVHGIGCGIVIGMLLRDVAELNIENINMEHPENAARLRVILTDVNRMVYVGQFQDMSFSKDNIPSEKEYFERCYRITGYFIQKCLELGALSADGDEQTLEWLRNFGAHYGVAVQIRNDLMDFLPIMAGTLSAGIKGCSHDDFREGKATLPVIKTLEMCNATEEAKIMERLGKRELNDKQMEEVNLIIERVGGFGYTIKKIEDYLDGAVSALENVPEGETKHTLTNLTEIAKSVRKWRFS